MNNKIPKLLFLLLPAAFSMQAQNVGINSGGTTPNTSAILDLNTGNTFTSPNGKGLLVPNVALTGTSDATTVASPATSLWVYNTATAGAGTTAVTPGFYYWNGTKWVAMGGGGGLDWSLTGNAGTTVGTNFLGTTDNTDLMFKVNSIKGGLIDIANFQTHFGYGAGLNNTSAGTLTSFFGAGAGQSNTSGTGNSGFGYNALVSNTTGTDNTAVGVQALYSTTGSGNVAMGTNAGYSITSGTNNTALGFWAMNNGGTAITGDYNTATGYKSLSKMTSGSFNTGTGYSALLNCTTGSANSGFGFDALYFFSTGSYNTANGGYALEGSGTAASNTGVANTAVGFCAGSGYSAFPVGSGTNNNLPVTTGSYNTFLGYSTDMSATTYSNSTTVGAFAQAGASDVVVLGSISGVNNAPNTAKVGIGTTAPATVLDVTGASSSRVTTITNTSTGDVLRTYSNGNTSAVGFAGLWSNVAPAGSGTNFGITTSNAGIQAQIVAGTTAGSQYSFAVFGNGNQYSRNGGVLGEVAVTAWASNGYYSSGGTVYGFYSLNAGTALSNRQASSPAENPAAVSGIGSGVYSDFMGGWVKGSLYGMHVKGNRYATYTEGKTFGNDVAVTLTENANSEKRIPSFASTSTSVDVVTKGVAELRGGRAHVSFEGNFKGLVSSKVPVIVTITPLGKSNGVYIENVSSEGFDVIENNSGASTVSFNWIAVGTKAGYEEVSLPEEILSKNYERNMQGVMFNESNTADNASPIWWDGSKLRFDKIPAELYPKQEVKAAQTEPSKQ